MSVPGTLPSSGRSTAFTHRAAALMTSLVMALGTLIVGASAVHAVGPGMPVLVGSLQSELGCAEDWAPDCDATALSPTGTEGVWAAEVEVPKGQWELKVTIGGSWDEAYGLDGGEDNIPLAVTAPTTVRFQFDAATSRLSISLPDQPGEYTEADAELAAAPHRHPGAGQTFYFVLTDRFANGDPANDTGGIEGDRLDHGFDPTHEGFYQGGDIAGLHSKLDYIEDLGISAIWLTPSFTNNPVQGEGEDASVGYHGYWVTDFTTIDPHLGTNEELKALIDDAHGRGIKVYFDIITNHTADLIDYEEGTYDYIDQATSPYRDADGNPVDVTALAQSPDFPQLDPATSFPYTPVRAPENEVMVPEILNDTSLYHNRGNSTWEGESVTFGDFDGLDDLMTEDPRVVATMEDIYTTWMDFGIDGFRIDTVKHVDFAFWQTFTQALVEHQGATPAGEQFFTFGEVYDADATKLSPYVRDTDMSSVLDFAYQSAATNWARGYSAEGFAALFRADDYYTTPSSSAADLPTFVGNHDMGRIGYLLRDSVRLDERAAFAHTSMLLTRGQPVIYYGDEQGFVGDGNDKGARQSMFPSQTPSYLDETLIDGSPYGDGDHFSPDAQLYPLISELATLRNTTPALSTGAQIELFTDEGPGVFAAARVDREEKIEHLVALNNAPQGRTVTLTTLTPGATYTPLYGDHAPVTAGADGSVEITVPALDGIVLVADQPVADSGAEQAITFDLVSGGALEGLAPISASLMEDRWAETSFSYRLAGEVAWTPLGTAEDDTPRVFHDVRGIPAGTVIEYRAVSTDADGSRVAASTTGVVGADLSADGATDAPGDISADTVTLPGSHNAAMGCTGDWQPDCAAAQLTLDEASGLYTGTFDIPQGTYTYKVAHGGSWDENYGANGVPDGEDISYTHDGGPITFWYDPKTHIVQSSAQGPFVTLPGSFNAALGCAEDWMPACMSTWMQDGDGDGVYTFTTTKIPAGSHGVKVAHGGSWDENYGVGGQRDGADWTFSTQQGKVVTFSYDISTHELTIEAEDPLVAGAGQQLAHFVDADTIAWPADRAADPSAVTWQLWAAPEGGLAVEDGAVTGGEQLGELSLREGGLEETELEGRAHLADFLALDLAGVDRATLEQALTGQLAVVQSGPDGIEVMTGLQIPGVLDALFAEGAAEAELGAVFDDSGAPTLSLWAPTAKEVSLRLSPGTPEEQVLPMERTAAGVWTITGEPSWEDRTYDFAVTVYVPAEDAVVTNEVTDPYSVGLTLNSEQSVLVDLDDERWAPAVWQDTPAPIVEQFADQTIYELHLRDFSGADEALPAEVRGTYGAFGHVDSTGTKRLQELADAGVTTVHLLPTFDIATIEEDRAAQVEPSIPDAGPASTEQQAAVAKVADQDAYNWGYDPFHYMVPEGSYARPGHQEGGERTAEFRSMVGELHGMGLQVVLDQVYNHTAAHGQAERSVLDQVVPGYYHRLNLTGGVESSTCCSNLATEHAMAERIMVDSTVLWARQYRVDGFRFDLMGHHSRANMEAVREALDELTLEADGVDGTSIYLYGEGWNFGEVENNARFPQATQGQLDGTSIGSFNDRLRDGVHGGSPFDVDKRTGQGFGNGQFTMPNGFAELSEEDQRKDLLHRTDLIRLGLAGNLKDYELLTSSGEVLRGDQLDYNGAPAGFATRPEESVNYVDAHDNEALYDLNVWKLPQDAPMEVRGRMNTLSLATVALGQSPAFWAGGTDLMRSKSLDRDSYNSGDHFNTIDWTMQGNGFGQGLPPEGKNGEAWDLMRPMLEDPAKSPTPEDIATSSEVTLDLLRLRSSSTLFTLGDAELIRQKVTFPGAGPEATPGLLVMRVDDTVGEDADPALDGLVTVFNASDETITEQIEGMAGLEYTLHPVQAEGADPVVKESTWDTASGTVTIPAHTVAVFIAKQAQDTGPGEPEDPEQPGDPEDPEQPGQPEDPAPSDPAPSGPADPADPAPDSSARGPLARTGIEAWALALAAAILLLGGATVTAGRRR